MAVNIPESSDSISIEDVLGETIENPSNLFGEPEEEQVAEEEVSAEEESEDEAEEEGDETSKEEAEDEEEAEEEKESNAIAENLKKALHAERAKRKEASEQLAMIREQAQAVLQEGNQYKAAYDSVVASLKENGLEDIIKVPKVEPVSEEVLEARKMKQQQAEAEEVRKFYDFVKTEATSLASDYSNVNLADNDQGVALTQIITAAVVSGVDRDQAVAEGLKVLNNVIANAKKEALKNRQPAVTPKAKPKARTKQPSSSTRSDMIKKGDFESLFASMGKQMAKS